MLVLEYMEGGDLHSCIQQDSWPVSNRILTWYNKGAGIARDIAKGLAFLHHHKVISYTFSFSSLVVLELAFTRSFAHTQ